MRGYLFLLLLVCYFYYTGAAVFITNTPTKNLDPSDPPTPCKTALQWEGRFSEWDHNSSTNNRYSISYDGVKRRKWIEEEQRSMRPGRRLFKFLILYDEQVEYKIDPKYNKCSKIAMGPWRNFSIPPSAIFEDHYQIGGPQGNLDVVEWSDREPAIKRESWIGGFTKVGCWPVFDIFTFVNDTVSIAFTTRFFDLTPGIKNMSIFDVPALCKTATDVFPSLETPGKDDDKPGIWDRWVPSWVKKLLGGQMIDNGGKIPPYDTPMAENPEPEVPEQGGSFPTRSDFPAFNPDSKLSKDPRIQKYQSPWSLRKP